MKADSLDEILRLAKAISEANRIKILFSLKTDELCACQITDYLGLAGSTVSRHMEILKQAGMIESEKRGRWIYFRLNENMSPIASSFTEKAISSFAQSDEYRKTGKLLDKICSEPAGKRCC